ncbi:MAG: hypothetical protein WCK02_09185 [Bacteroidota bacterium]
MRESDFTLSKIKEFESLEKITVSEKWNNDVINKISTNKKRKTFTTNSMTTIIIFIFIVLINLGLLLKPTKNHIQQCSNRKNDLKIISNEFLITPLSENN